MTLWFEGAARTQHSHSACVLAAWPGFARVSAEV